MAKEIASSSLGPSGNDTAFGAPIPTELSITQRR
jgi:hypothetical protein